jgi:hypothetical protein
LKSKSYPKYGWKICGDLKDIGLSLGMQTAYTKFCFFFVNGTALAKDKNNKLKAWSMREIAFLW